MVIPSLYKLYLKKFEFFFILIDPFQIHHTPHTTHNTQHTTEREQHTRKTHKNASTTIHHPSVQKGLLIFTTTCGFQT